MQTLKTRQALKIGIDFDNTIVCYEQVFHQIALEKELIPASLPVSKNEVRNYLRQQGQEDHWTELQGYVYGCRMADAKPFPDALETIAQLIANDIDCVIISHKTRYPYQGQKYDLHSAAQQWLEQHGFFTKLGMHHRQVFFELSQGEKLTRINEQQCSHFIDDLPELLEHTDFPAATTPLLFDPQSRFVQHDKLHPVHHWRSIKQQLLNTHARDTLQS